MANVIYTVPLAESALISALSYNLLANSNANVSIGGGSNGQALITNGSGNLSWGNVGTGTVTNIATSGSGLGFSLTGGPITTTGTITLTVPNATSLRSSLTIGNVANLNLNGNGSTYLSGNGTFSVPPGSYSNSNVASYLPTYTGNIGSSGANMNYLWANYVSARFDVTANTVSAPNITSTLLLTGVTGNFSGNLNSNNLNVTNLITGATGNITTINSTTGNFSGNVSGNIIIANTANITGNVRAGNVIGGNLVTANFISGNGYLLTGVTANFANYAGQVTNSSQPNITSIGNLITLTVTGNSNLGNTATANFFVGNGNGLSNIQAANISGTIANANYAAYAGNVTISAQPNITSVGTLTGVTVNGYANITQANLSGNANISALYIPNGQEKVTVDGTGITPTVNYDIATQSILYYTGNAGTNWTVNFRASNTTTLNNMMAANSVMTVTLIVPMGASGYYANSHQVDGTTVTVNWQGNAAISGGVANSKNVYSYSLIKTAANTFTVLGSLTQFT